MATERVVTRDLTPLLLPRSIAVVGATDRRDAYGDTILTNLERLGFRGPVWGVNPRRKRVHDVPCVPTIDDLPEPVDTVAIAIPAPAVPEAIAAVARRGCGGAVVVSAGFGEISEGVERERALVAAANEGGIPVCGPNGNGIISFGVGAAVWGDAIQALEPGPVALISQSGNLAVNALASRRGIGFHTVISTGNSAVCDAADWLLAVSEREGVRSVALFLESDGDGDRLAEGLARCAERGIGVTALKVGSSRAGAAAAGAHTGALAGDQLVFRALLEEAGAAIADDPHELLELARVMAEPRAWPDRTGGLAILTCSGGDSGIAADQAERAGLDLPPLGAETRQRLDELLPEAATAANPLDYTSLLWGETERLRDIVATVGADPAVDQTLVIHDTPPDLPEEAVTAWEETREGLIRGLEASPAPLFASTLPELISDGITRELAGHGIAAAFGLDSAICCARSLRTPAADPSRLREIAAATSRTVAGSDGEWLGEAEAKRLCREAGIPVPDGRTAADAEAAVRVAEDLGYPVALKLSGPAIQHKSDLGAIKLGITGPAELRDACERLIGLPEAANSELLVERMSEPGVELIVAARADAVVPALVVGLGGIWTETLGDVAIIPLPAAAGRVERALRSLKGSGLLTGGRGREPVDLAALADAASRAGDLMLDRGLALLELNPVIAGPAGCSAVDALARRAGFASNDRLVSATGRGGGRG